MKLLANAENCKLPGSSSGFVRNPAGLIYSVVKAKEPRIRGYLVLVPGGGYPVCIVPKFRGYLGTGTRVMRFSSRNAYENGFLEARRGKVEKVGRHNQSDRPTGRRSCPIRAAPRTASQTPWGRVPLLYSRW